jgi:hypothetical protein
MSCVRHHDRYDDGYVVDPAAGYQSPKVAEACCASEEGRS